MAATNETLLFTVEVLMARRLMDLITEVLITDAQLQLRRPQCANQWLAANISACGCKPRLSALHTHSTDSSCVPVTPRIAQLLNMATTNC